VARCRGGGPGRMAFRRRRAGTRRRAHARSREWGRAGARWAADRGEHSFPGNAITRRTLRSA
jgi:hypothetical protein